MPGTVLRVYLQTLNHDFLETLSLNAYRTWQRGDLKSERSDKRYDSSGFACNVSDVCEQNANELTQQIEDAMQFMSHHAVSLAILASSPDVEERRFDFGISSRIDVNEIAVQGEFLPLEFLEQVARYKIAVAISIYPMAANDELQRR